MDRLTRMATANHFESKTSSSNRQPTAITGYVAVITRAALIKKNKRTHISHPSCSQCAGVCARKTSSGGDNYTSSMTNHVREHLASDCNGNDFVILQVWIKYSNITFPQANCSLPQIIIAPWIFWYLIGISMLANYSRQHSGSPHHAHDWATSCPWFMPMNQRLLIHGHLQSTQLQLLPAADKARIVRYHAFTI